VASTAVVIYSGPSSGAPECARALADAEGIELRASNRLPGPSDDVAVLELTIEGSETDIERAVVAVSRELPPGASLNVE
jgi:hypothetical protein